ncbi:MAG: hypothetical protein ACLFWL_09335 [Candidatus Brocadiia bacterium]
MNVSVNNVGDAMNIFLPMLMIFCAALITSGLEAGESSMPGDLTAEQIGATLGAGGHFIQHRTPVYLNNPEGEDFEIEMFFFVKGWIDPSREERILLIDPDGETVVSGMQTLDEDRIKIEVKDTAPGVYTLEPGRREDRSFEGRVTDYWPQTTPPSNIACTSEPPMAFTNRGPTDVLTRNFLTSNPVD